MKVTSAEVSCIWFARLLVLVCPSACEKIVPAFMTAGKLYQRLKLLLYEKELVLSTRTLGYSHFIFITVVNLSFGHSVYKLVHVTI